MSGPGGVGAYVWTDSEVNRILDNAVAAAKAAGISEPKILAVKARDIAAAITVYAENNDLTTLLSAQAAKTRSPACDEDRTQNNMSGG